MVSKNVSEKKDVLSAYVHTYLQEEIRNEGIIRNLGAFSRFLDIVASQNGECINFSAIARECFLSYKTVQSYYEILEETLLAVRLPPWTRSIRKRMVAHSKYYLFDTGVTNAINRRLSAPPDPVNRGRLFEQFMILETCRIASYAHSEASVYYWRTSNGAEVDLLIEKHGKLLAACEFKSSARISGADCSGVRAFADEYPQTPCYIISSARNAFDIGPVHVLPWRDYFALLDTVL